MDITRLSTVKDQSRCFAAVTHINVMYFLRNNIGGNAVRSENTMAASISQPTFLTIYTGTQYNNLTTYFITFLTKGRSTQSPRTSAPNKIRTNSSLCWISFTLRRRMRRWMHNRLEGMLKEADVAWCKALSQQDKTEINHEKPLVSGPNFELGTFQIRKQIARPSLSGDFQLTTFYQHLYEAGHCSEECEHYI
jgi:hypothetical protein